MGIALKQLLFLGFKRVLVQLCLLERRIRKHGALGYRVNLRTVSPDPVKAWKNNAQNNGCRGKPQYDVLRHRFLPFLPGDMIATFHRTS